MLAASRRIALFTALQVAVFAGSLTGHLPKISFSLEALTLLALALMLLLFVRLLRRHHVKSDRQSRIDPVWFDVIFMAAAIPFVLFIFQSFTTRASP